MKLARYVTGRPRFIGFLGGFHGRTMGSLAFTSSKYTQQKGFFPTMPGVTHVPYPNPYRPLFAGADQGQAVLDYIEHVLFPGSVPPSEVAAILVEPIQGEGGYLVPPDGFLSGLRGAVRPPRHPADLRRGAVRRGTHREDVREPALGRGARHHDPRQGPRLAASPSARSWRRSGSWRSGPAAPTATRSAAIPSAAPPPWRRSSSSSGSYAANAAAVGEHFLARLRELQARHEVIGDVRGKGLMIGMELVKDRASRAPAKELCDAVIRRAFHNGLILLSCGASTVRFMPPLLVTRAEVDEAVALLEASLVEARDAAGPLRPSGRSTEDDGPVPVDEDSILEDVARRAREHRLLDVPTQPDHVLDRVPVVDADHVLLDDRTLVQAWMSRSGWWRR